jgi:hypothetical protein
MPVEITTEILLICYIDIRSFISCILCSFLTHFICQPQRPFFPSSFISVLHVRNIPVNEIQTLIEMRGHVIV